MVGGLILLGIIAASVVTGVVIYNSLITLGNRFRNAYSQVDVQLQRRYDLIPNLVETAKGYLKHERETLEAVIRARNQAHDANRKAAENPGESEAMQAVGNAEAALTGVLGRFFALAEAYPDLKANQTMERLMEELTSTENRIAFARQAYNDAVMEYNIAREKIPNALIAGPCGFKEAVLLEIPTPEARKAVKVSFS